MDELKTGLVNLVTVSLEGKFDVDNFYQVLQGLGAADVVGTCLVDVFWLFWAMNEGHSDKRLKLVEMMKACLNDKKVVRKTAFENWETECLQATNLIPDLSAWKTKEVKTNTKMQYLQVKFNLLREDSEGYAKLLICLNQFGEAGLTQATLHAALHDIQALIGCFDLDPNRVLALILQAYEQQPQNSTFIDLIRSFKVDAVVDFLAYKYSQFQDIAAPPAERSLFLISASLIKAGIVSADQLLDFLTPSEEAVQEKAAVTAVLISEAVERIGEVNLVSATQGVVRPPLQPGHMQHAATGNAMGVAWAAGPPPPPAATRRGLSAKDIEMDAVRLLQPIVLDNSTMLVHNQKLDLLEALMAVDAWEPANDLADQLSALGMQLPTYPAIASVLCRALAAEVDPVYYAMFQRGNILGGNIMDCSSRSAALASSTLSNRALEILQQLGIFLSHDVALFDKVVRVLRHELVMHGAPKAGATEAQCAEAKAVKSKMEDLISTILLPALCLVPMNVPLVDDVWQMLQTFPFHTRYRFYSNLKETQQQVLHLNASSRMAVQEVSFVLKRLTAPVSDDRERQRKENNKSLARLLAKSSTSNPLPAMGKMVQMVTSYDNQIDSMVEVMRLGSALAFDMLTYAILAYLTEDRPKVKEDGLNVTDWLQHISTFSARFCCRHPDMDITAVAQYLVNSLRSGNSSDLQVLKELIDAMTGIKVMRDMSDQQMDGCAGGALLMAEALMDKGKDEYIVKQQRKSRQRLLDALLKGPTSQHLAMPLLVLTAQQRTIVMTGSQNNHIKNVTELFDKCQNTCIQYIQFLHLTMALEEYSAQLPPVDILRLEYGVDSEIAFLAHRPLLLELFLATSPPPVEELEEGEQAAVDDATQDGAAAIVPSVCLHGKSWQDSVAMVRRSIPSKTFWQAVSPELYTVFWTLSLQDIYTPQARYDKEVAAARSEVQDAEKKLRMTANYEREKKDACYAARDKFQDLVTRLEKEAAERKRHVEVIHSRITRDKLLLPGQEQLQKRKGTKAPVLLVQECILRRALLSPMDALYSSRFLHVLHILEIPGLSNIMIYNSVICDLPSVLPNVTDTEAENLGIFLLDVFRVLERWRASQQVFDAECANKPGFALPGVGVSTSLVLDFNAFLLMMNKWQTSLSNALKSCLECGNYMAIRNALTVLNRLISVFPTVLPIARSIKDLVEKVDIGKRKDLEKLTTGYLAFLKLEMAKDKRMMSQSDYGGLPSPPKKPSAGTQASKATLASSTSASKLRPLAKSDSGTSLTMADAITPAAVLVAPVAKSHEAAAEAGKTAQKETPLANLPNPETRVPAIPAAQGPSVAPSVSQKPTRQVHGDKAPAPKSHADDNVKPAKTSKPSNLGSAASLPAAALDEKRTAGARKEDPSPRSNPDRPSDKVPDPKASRRSDPPAKPGSSAVPDRLARVGSAPLNTASPSKALKRKAAAAPGEGDLPELPEAGHKDRRANKDKSKGKEKEKTQKEEKKDRHEREKDSGKAAEEQGVKVKTEAGEGRGHNGDASKEADVIKDRRTSRDADTSKDRGAQDRDTSKDRDVIKERDAQIDRDTSRDMPRDPAREVPRESPRDNARDRDGKRTKDKDDRHHQSRSKGDADLPAPGGSGYGSKQSERTDRPAVAEGRRESRDSLPRAPVKGEEEAEGEQHRESRHGRSAPAAAEAGPHTHDRGNELPKVRSERHTRPETRTPNKPESNPPAPASSEQRVSERGREDGRSNQTVKASPQTAAKLDTRDDPSSSAAAPRQQQISESSDRPPTKASGSSRDIHFDMARPSTRTPAKDSSNSHSRGPALAIGDDQQRRGSNDLSGQKRPLEESDLRKVLNAKKGTRTDDVKPSNSRERR